MKKRTVVPTTNSYIRWTNEEIALLAHLMSIPLAQRLTIREAAEFAAKKLGRSIESCAAMYHDKIKKGKYTPLSESQILAADNLENIDENVEKISVETEIDTAEPVHHPFEIEIERLNHEIVKLREEKQQMLQDMMNFANSAISVFTNIEFGTGQITMHDIDYQLSTLVRTLNYRYGQKQ